MTTTGAEQTADLRQIDPAADGRDVRVLLARHGRTALNAHGRLRGHLDPPLDEVGLREAEDLAVALAGMRPARVVSSPLRRAVQTAEAIARRAGVAVTVDERLTDRDYGPWAGEPEADVIAEWGGLDAAPGVERAHWVVARARAALDEAVSAASVSAGIGDGAPPEPRGSGSVVLVAHDAVNRLLLASLDPRLGSADQIEQRTACWNVLHRAGADWRVERVDEKLS
jgi:broad specificity phosphatase PhoE